MTNVNEKKDELRELDHDLSRLMNAVRPIKELEGSSRIIFGGFGAILVFCGIAALAGSYFLAVKSEISFVFAGLTLTAALICLFFGARLLTVYFKLRQNLKKTSQVIAHVRARKSELEREIASFAD